MPLSFLDDPVVLSDMEEIYGQRSDWDVLDGASVYVTGGAGMIASYMVMFLVFLNERKGLGVDVYCGSRSEAKARRRFGGHVDADYFKLVSADASGPAPDSVKADYIVHAASLASPQYYGLQPVEVILPNAMGAYNLLEYCRANSCRGMLFFSSGSVYGAAVSDGPMDEETESRMSFLDLGNLYGLSKQCGEALCRAYALEHGVRAMSARIHHSYGPTVDLEGDARVFAEFARCIVQRRDIVMKSDGSAMRAFCYMTDLISGLFAILLDGRAGESYNIGNPSQFMSIAELASRLVAAFPDRNMHVVRQVRDDPGYHATPDVPPQTISIEKLRALGWSPTICVEEGFRRVVESFEGRGCLSKGFVE